MEPKLEISPDFTLEDIHKIREYHYEMTKNMTTEERISYHKRGAEKCLQEFEEYKERKKKIAL